MRSRDPQRVLRAIRRTTVGSLLAALVGSGFVAVHLAGDHASAAAAAATRASDDRAVREEQVPQPEPTPQPVQRPSTKTRHHTTRKAPAPARAHPGFQPVAPVEPSTGPAQSGSGGS